MKYILSAFFILVSLSVHAEAIKTGDDGKSWTLHSGSSVYDIRVRDGQPAELYHFGTVFCDTDNLGRPIGPEIPVRGGHYTCRPVAEAVFSDGVRDLELEFVNYEIDRSGEYPVLALVHRDIHYPLEITEYIRVIDDYGLYEKWTEVRNTGRKQDVVIENMQSGNFYLPKGQYEMHDLTGHWGDEFQPSVTLLTPGVKTVEVKNFRSFGSSFFAIRPEGEESPAAGKVWFGTLKYSGNWRMDFEKFTTGEVQVASGINFWDENIVLGPGESFVSPEWVFGYTENGMDGVTHRLSEYIRNKVVYTSHRGQARPVLYNSWYATEFDVNMDQQLELAKIAKELGVEIFVIDDGWFKGRFNDNGGLGDWTVDRTKFPDGLTPLIEKVNDMGMDFGIWIEPEMVNENSDLYRSHPDWVLHYPTRTRHTYRNQLMLNLAREDVYQYLHKSISNLLKDHNIKYVKWDFNRGITEPGWPDAEKGCQRSVRIKYVQNLYRLYDSLRSEFPDVWFENCASGGGRVDLGMMSRTDFSWASDNTDPVDRTFIQYSYLGIFPANTMISWVTFEDHHRQGHSLDFKFDVALSGVLGIGYDITEWTEEERALAAKKVALYKEIRETVHNGKQYLIESPYLANRSVIQFVSQDGAESVVFVYNLAEYLQNSSPETKSSSRVALKGLDPEALYSIDGISGVHSGSSLMNYGLEFPVYGAYKSGIFKLHRM